MKHLPSTLIAAAIGLLASTGAEAAPFDIVQCMTISQSGSYRLAGNLQSGLGDCIVVLTDNVSIDLAGFTIRGRSRGAGILARIAGVAVPLGDTYTGTSIRGGTITGFDTGIDVDEGAVVEHMHIVGNEYDGIRALRGQLTARYNTVRLNARTLDRRAAGIDAGSLSLITDNVVTRQGEAAVGIAYVCPSVIIHNVVASNGPLGNQRNVVVSAGTGSTLDCVVEKNVTGSR